MKTNEELQKDVQEAIKWEPLLDPAEIGVIVKDGVVTLTGTVDSFVKKLEAEIATKKVLGVKAIIDKIEIEYSDAQSRTDEHITQKIVDSLNANWDIPENAVTVTVEKGWVTLDGILTWNYQKDSAKTAVQRIEGIKGITNNITLKALSKDMIERKVIEEALDRNWAINQNNIHVDVTDNKVRLTGKVASYYEKEEAEKIAWKTPGIVAVINELVIH